MTARRKREDPRNDYAVWYKVPRDFLRALPMVEGLLLAYLANIAYIVVSKERQDGWFYCKMDRIETELGLTGTRQTRAIKALRERGLLRVKLKGNPARRYLKINWPAIKELIAELPDLDDEEFYLPD